MKLSFMSFLYPSLDAASLIEKAKRFRYHGIEWRAEADHAHGVELDASTGAVQAIRREVSEAGLETSCLATSMKFASSDRSDRDAQLERLGRLIDLGVEIGAPRIRFFADPIPNGGRRARESSYAWQTEYIVRACERALPAKVMLCLETHSNFRAFDAGEVMYRSGYPHAFRINWHLQHCLNHGEDVDEAYRHVKGRVDHAHFSMSPEIERQMELLAAEGFEGFFSLEMMPKEPEEQVDRIVADQSEQWWRLYDGLFGKEEQ